MPFIHVRSLPFRQSFDVERVVNGLARDFAKGTGIGLKHVTVTWEFLDPGHYAVAGKSARHQPRRSHPVLVDLLAPEFNSPAAVGKMMTTVASSIARRTRVSIRNIFINHREVRSRMVFDAGGIVRW